MQTINHIRKKAMSFTITQTAANIFLWAIIGFFQILTISNNNTFWLYLLNLVQITITLIS